MRTIKKIKLIIDVDEKYYEACKDAVKEPYPSQLDEVIANGIPYNPTVKPNKDNEAAQYSQGYYDGFMSAKELITKEPERPKGEWIEKEETPASVSYYCSNCECVGLGVEHFCSWCGADMRGDTK